MLHIIHWAPQDLKNDSEMKKRLGKDTNFYVPTLLHWSRYVRKERSSVHRLGFIEPGGEKGRIATGEDSDCLINFTYRKFTSRAATLAFRPPPFFSPPGFSPRNAGDDEMTLCRTHDVSGGGSYHLEPPGKENWGKNCFRSLYKREPWALTVMTLILPTQSLIYFCSLKKVAEVWLVSLANDQIRKCVFANGCTSFVFYS